MTEKAKPFLHTTAVEVLRSDSAPPRRPLPDEPRSYAWWRKRLGLDDAGGMT